MIGSFDDACHGRPMSEINLTPLVDVMLVLLIVFIVTAPLFTHSIQIDLPQARADVTHEKPNTISLAIDDEGRFFWNDELLDRGQLSRKLEESVQRHPQPELHIRADKNTRYQTLADVMAEAQRLRLQRVGFVTNPETAK